MVTPPPEIINRLAEQGKARPGKLSLKDPRGHCTLGAVDRLTKTIAAVMLVFYGLALLHCDLEQLSGFGFLACCQHQEASAPHQDKDCEQDACSVVENGFYEAHQHPAAAPIPCLVLSYLLPSLETPVSNDPSLFEIASSAPPELLRVWQFSWRTALPPRAPSLLS